jgi:hypothetical protein
MENNKEKERILSDLSVYLLLINIGLFWLLLFLDVDWEIATGVAVAFYAASFYIIMKLDK